MPQLHLGLCSGRRQFTPSYIWRDCSPAWSQGDGHPQPSRRLRVFRQMSPICSWTSQRSAGQRSGAIAWGSGLGGNRRSEVGLLSLHSKMFADMHHVTSRTLSKPEGIVVVAFSFFYDDTGFPHSNDNLHLATFDQCI